MKVEQVAGLPLLRVIVDRAEIAPYGLTAEDVLRLVQTTRLGTVAGTVVQAPGGLSWSTIDRPRLPGSRHAGQSVDPTMHGELVPLSRVTMIVIDSGPAQISREHVQRRIVVECNIRGRDPGQLRGRGSAGGDPGGHPSLGYELIWDGQYEHLQEAASTTRQRSCR